MQSVVKLDNVTKTYKLYKNDRDRFWSTFRKSVQYKEKTALKNINIDIGAGESVALFGRNGAGKSTILKMVTGVTYPTTGEVTVKGRVGALLELTSGFDPEFTGRENIYFKCQLGGMTEKEIAEVEDEIVEFADIGEYIEQPLRTYSSGMKSRLGFAINACMKPDVLIVDEALSVGDTQFRNKCMNRINKLIEEDNVTLLFVTHSLDSAKKFCKRGIVLRAGSVLFDGPISEAAYWYNESLKRKEPVRSVHVTSEKEKRKARRAAKRG